MANLRRMLVGSCALAVMVGGAACTLLVDTRSSQCQTHSDCADLYGQEGYCVPGDHVCVKATTSACSTIVPADALTKPNALLIAFMGSLSSADGSTPYGASLREGAELAIDEITRSGPGLPKRNASESSRPLGMLICDDGGSADSALPVAKHLANTLKLPAIIGPVFSGVTSAVANQVTVQAGTLLLSPSATSPSISSIPDNDLVWRTVPSDSIQVKPITKLVARTEQLMRANGEIAEGETLRLGVVWRVNSWGDAIASALLEALAEAGYPRTPAQYPAPSQLDDVNYAEVLAPITNIKPHIVIALAIEECGTRVLPEIERAFDKLIASDPKQPRPRYIVPEACRDSLPSSELSGARADTYKRILGTAPGPCQGRYAAFADQFRAARGKSPGNLAEFGYDAAYLLAYATAYTGVLQPTAKQLAHALRQLSCKSGGEIIEPGLTRFVKGFGLAAQQRCVDYEGISGPLDFDQAGDVVGDFRFWCPYPNRTEASCESWFSYDEQAIQGAAVDFCK